jgi:hypothetical protein
LKYEVDGGLWGLWDLTCRPAHPCFL